MRKINHADVLVKISLVVHLVSKRTLLMEFLSDGNISNDLEVLKVVEERYTWIKEIVGYIVDRSLPPNKSENWKLQMK